MMILLILKIIGLSFVITKFTPLVWVIEAIQMNIKNKVLSFLVNIISLLTSCLPCCSFWTGILLGGFWTGVLSYVIAYVYTHSKLSSWDKIYVN